MIARISLGVVLVVAGAASAAEPPPPGGIPDLAGPRALALGGATGLAHSGEGLFVNPATIGARRRAAVEAGAFADRRGDETVGRWFGTQVVDAITAPVAGAFSYVYADEGLYTGNLWEVAFAGPILQGLHFGLGGKYYSLEGPDPVGAVTLDAGFFWEVAPYLTLGAAGFNLVPIANDAVAPMGTAVGLGLGSDRGFQLTADWRVDLDRGGKSLSRYAVGAELLLGQLVPLRAGWTKDEVLGTEWWSVGVGLVTRGGVALDFGYRQSFDDLTARTLALTLKVFMLQ